MCLGQGGWDTAFYVFCSLFGKQKDNNCGGIKCTKWEGKER